MLTSPPVLKLLDSQGYLAKVIKVIGVTFEPKKYLLCHSFQIIVIMNSSQFPPIPDRRENWTAKLGSILKLDKAEQV